jgi:pyruvate/2-oxoglutarate dehydrogenase complex dihydrolipoamide acyltransferase (E2) component
MRALIRSAAVAPLLAYIVVSSAAAQPSASGASSDAAAPAPTAAADSAAEVRLRQMLALIDSGDRAAARTFVEGSFAPGLLREGGPAPFLSELARLHHTTDGLELHGMMGVEEGRAMALVHARLTDTWVALTSSPTATSPSSSPTSPTAPSPC